MSANLRERLDGALPREWTTQLVRDRVLDALVPLVEALGDEQYRAGRLAGAREAERFAALRAAHEQAAHERRERAAYAAGQARAAGAAP